MSRKKKIFIIIIALVVFLLFLLFFWLLWSKKMVVVKKSNPSANTQIITNAAAREEAEPEISVLTDQQTAVAQSGLESLARAFAERYGSFSSESELANLRDILDFMSSGLQVKTESYIVSVKPSVDYYGITTRVLAVEVVALDDTGGTAEVSVSTQRSEAKSSPQNTNTFYQTLLLDYVKEGGLWKVTSAVWQ